MRPLVPVFARQDITLCGPSLPFEPFKTCLMEVDEQCRSSCGYDPQTGAYNHTGDGCLLLTCAGKVLKRGDNHTIHGFQTDAGRRAWGKVFSDWRASGAIDGVIWDGMDHGGGPDSSCSKNETDAFLTGESVCVCVCVLSFCVCCLCVCL